MATDQLLRRSFTDSLDLLEERGLLTPEPAERARNAHAARRAMHRADSAADSRLTSPAP
jgi:hypothetical protein